MKGIEFGPLRIVNPRALFIALGRERPDPETEREARQLLDRIEAGGTRFLPLRPFFRTAFLHRDLPSLMWMVEFGRRKLILTIATRRDSRGIRKAKFQAIA